MQKPTIIIKNTAGLYTEHLHDLVSHDLVSPRMFQDLRRNQRRLAELNSSIRKLEDRNSLLVDERNELV